MQSLGIYGDSFADPNTCNTSVLRAVAWPSLLKAHYNVTNYALGGSSLYYSYRIFLNTHHMYDKCLFLSADWSRDHNCVIDINNDKKGFNSLFTIYSCYKNQPELLKDIDIKNKLFALEQYYLYLENNRTNIDLCTLMTEKIKQLRPDVFLMDTSNYKRDTTAKHYFDVLDMFCDYKELLLSLNNSKIEDSLKERGWIAYPEKNTVCHFPAEINEMIAQHVKMFLETRTWPEAPKSITFNHPADYYWDLSKQID